MTFLFPHLKNTRRGTGDLLQFFLIYFFFFLIGKAERAKESSLAHFQITQQLGLDQITARSQELHLAPPTWWQGPEHVGRLPLLSQVQQQGTGSEVERVDSN